MEVNVGKIVNMHGIRGEVKVLSASDFASERFKKGKQVKIKFQGKENIFTIKSYRVHKNFHMLQFEGVQNINEVEKFKGHDLFQDVEDIDLQLEENEYYYSDIIGCDVYNGTDLIGKVTEIFETGANDVWVVKGDKEHLIPYIEQVVKMIDIDQKRIEIEAMDGLLS